jgi:hypothetical protein
MLITASILRCCAENETQSSCLHTPHACTGCNTEHNLTLAAKSEGPLLLLLLLLLLLGLAPTVDCQALVLS